MSKGGHCVYSGSPQILPYYLYNFGINITEEQIPIEVLLKYSCNQFDDKYVQQMTEITKEIEMISINERKDNEIDLYGDGIKQFHKRFYLGDLWLLLKRGLTYNIRFYWKINLMQIIAFIGFGLMLRILYNPNIGIPSGCISFDDDFNNTCIKTKEKLEEEKRLNSNFKYNVVLVMLCTVNTMLVTVLSFSFDIRIFFNEQKNGMSFR